MKSYVIVDFWCYGSNKCVLSFSLIFQDRSNQKKQMDPINALQNLTNQGARNPMPTGQMMMGNNPNASALQNLIHVSIQTATTPIKCAMNSEY